MYYNHSFVLLVTRTYYHVQDVRTEERASIQMYQMSRLCGREGEDGDPLLQTPFVSARLSILLQSV